MSSHTVNLKAFALSACPPFRRYWEHVEASPQLQSLLREGIWVAFGQVASAIGVLVGIRLLTEYVSPEVFGKVSLLIGIVSLGSSIFCLPLLQAALRFYPELATRMELPVLRRTIRGSLRWSIGFLIGIILLGGAAYSILQGISYSIFPLLAGLLAIETKRGLETNFLTAARRQRPFSIWVAAEAWVRPASAILAVIMLGASPQSVLLGYLAGTAGVLLIFLIVLKREGLTDASQIQRPNSGFSKEIWHYTRSLIPLGIVGWISSLSDRYIIGGMLGLEQVGIYAAAYGIINRGFSISGGIIELTLRPAYFQAVSSGDKVLELKTFRTWLGLTAVMCMGGVLAVYFLRNCIASLLLAETYRSSAALMPWIAAGMSLLIMAYVFEKPCYAYKQTKWVLLIQGTGALTSIGIGLVLVFLYGLWGAAIAVPIYYGFQFLVSCYAAQKVIAQKSKIND